MAMFGKSDSAKNAEEEMQKIDNEAISSIIDNSMTITGEISFKGKARIDGTIHGNINGEHLVLSDTGRVIGDIAASSFNCYGSLEGNVKANIITARKNCSIQGKLEANSLTVEPGAAIQGEIKAAAQDVTIADEKKPTPISAAKTSK